MYVVHAYTQLFFLEFMLNSNIKFKLYINYIKLVYIII